MNIRGEGSNTGIRLSANVEWSRVPASPPKVPNPSLLKSLYADPGPRVCGVGLWRGCCLPLPAGQ